MRLSGIYAFTNLNDGSRYVGQARNIEKRRADHLSMLRRGKHTNRRFQRAFIRDGEGAFCFEVLCYCDVSRLCDAEQRFLDVLPALYNFSPIAQANGAGERDAEAKANIKSGVKRAFERDPSYRKRQHDSYMARLQSDPSLRVKLRDAQIGKKQSIETRAKRSASVKATKGPAEHRALVSVNSKRVWADPEFKEKHKQRMEEAITDEVLAKRNEAIKKAKAERFADPAYRAAISEKLKAAWAKRKKLNVKEIKS